MLARITLRVFLSLVALAAFPYAVAEPGYLPMVQLVSAQIPFYPETARQCRIEGVVQLDYILDRDGNVTDAHPVAMWPTDPTLEKAAVANVKTWKFRWYASQPPLSSSHRIEFIYKLSEKLGARVAFTTQITVHPGRIVVEADRSPDQPKCAPSAFAK